MSDAQNTPNTPSPEAELNDFRGGADDASLEDTLSQYKEDESASQNSILNSAETPAEPEQQPTMPSPDGSVTEVASSENEEDMMTAELLAQVENEAEILAKKLQSDLEAKNEARRLAPAIEETMAQETVQAMHSHSHPAPASVTPLHSGSRQPHHTQSPPPAGQNSDGTVSMTLTGSMKLKLCYERDGSTVAVHFSDDGFVVEFSDGTELKVPTRKSKAA